ncbi:MAG: 30S ribosomal protein S16 [Candidatus Roizmanbacteria bacterium]|nr:30S ribosomal protein S16 [Candidatus Roizmanbacteria bacterium]
MLIIRLQPTGRVKRKSYRIVVDEKRSKLVGRSVDDLGYYNPSEKPVKFKYDKEKLSKWVKQGAQISDAVSKLISTEAAQK